jgi:hypothetical protein
MAKKFKKPDRDAEDDDEDRKPNHLKGGLLLNNRLLPAIADRLLTAFPRPKVAAMRLLAHLWDFFDENGECFPKDGTLAVRMGVTRPRIVALKKQLFATGLISQQGGKYRLHREELKDEKHNQYSMDQRNEAKEKARAAGKNAWKASEEAIKANAKQHREGDRAWREELKAEREAERGADKPAEPAAAEAAPPIAPAEAPAKPPRPFALDDRVIHPKGGIGTVERIDGTTISVWFDRLYDTRDVGADDIQHAPEGATLHP